MKDIMRIKEHIKNLYPDVQTELTEFSQTVYELAIQVGEKLVLVEWRENKYFGVSTITPENQVDKMFINYHDDDFTNYDDALRHIMSLFP